MLIRTARGLVSAELLPAAGAIGSALVVLMVLYAGQGAYALGMTGLTTAGLGFWFAATFAWVSVEHDALVVTKLFGARRFNPLTTGVHVRMPRTARTRVFVVELVDPHNRIAVAEFISMGGTELARRKVLAVLAQAQAQAPQPQAADYRKPAHPAVNPALQQALDAEWDATRRAMAAAKAQVYSFYKTKAFWGPVTLCLGLMILFQAGIWIYISVMRAR